MTLVVYKNNMLAADARATINKGMFDEHDHCAHCGEEAHVVDDRSAKITLPKENQEIKFRNSRVLAVGQAGNQQLSRRMVSALMSGKNIEEIYQGYLVVCGPSTENKSTSSFLICCEDCNYTVRIPLTGELEVKKLAKDSVAAIGADLKVVEWIHTLMPDSSAASIINLVMAKNKGIGGPIKVVYLAESPLTIKDHEKKDPARLLTGAVEIFKMGKEAIRANEIKAAIKPQRARKPVRKTPTA